MKFDVGTVNSPYKERRAQHDGGHGGDSPPSPGLPRPPPAAAHLTAGATDSNRAPRGAQPMGAPLSAVPSLSPPHVSRALIGR